MPVRSNNVAFKSTDFKGHSLIFAKTFVYEKDYFNRRIKKGGGI